MLNMNLMTEARIDLHTIRKQPKALSCLLPSRTCCLVLTIFQIFAAAVVVAVASEAAVDIVVAVVKELQLPL